MQGILTRRLPDVHTQSLLVREQDNGRTLNLLGRIETTVITDGSLKTFHQKIIPERIVEFINGYPRYAWTFKKLKKYKVHLSRQDIKSE